MTAKPAPTKAGLHLGPAPDTMNRTPQRRGLFGLRGVDTDRIRSTYAGMTIESATVPTAAFPADHRRYAVEAAGLRKEYGAKVAVDSLTLTVDRGTVFGFLGPNGAGKTTAMKMLLGLVRPTAGEARLLGRPLTDLDARARIGFLPEQFRFHEWMRADELLDFHGKLAGMPKQRRRERIPEVLTLVGLSTRGRDRLRSFSKGMLQRVGIGQAIIHDPELVFLDEPTSALDPIGRREVRDIIHHLRERGTTVFLNSHLLSEIEQVCDRVVILDHGRVVRSGPLDELLRQELEVEIEAEPLTPELLAALRPECDTLRREGSLLTVTLSDRERIPRVAALITGSGARLYRLAARTISLEELFVETVEESGDR
jgi:ABC-2 type transport system ATP-binding protein